MQLSGALLSYVSKNHSGHVCYNLNSGQSTRYHKLNVLSFTQNLNYFYHFKYQNQSINTVLKKFSHAI